MSISIDDYIPQPGGERQYRNARITMEGEKKLLGKCEEIKPRISWIRNTPDHQQLMRKGKDRFRPLFITVVLAVIIGSTLLFTAFAGQDRTPELSPYSNDWNDLSKLRSTMKEMGYDTESVLSTPSLLDTLSKGEIRSRMLVIIGVERPYAQEEVNKIESFVVQGGVLLLADDFGHGNTILENMEENNGEAFYNGHLWDINFEKNPKFVEVVANPVKDFYFSGTLMLNEPTALSLPPNYNVVAQSTQCSWVDINDNEVIDGGEEGYDSYPVAAFTTYGKGHIALFSDPSAFINDMIVKEDNLAFIRALTGYLLPEGTVVFDESAHLVEDDGSMLVKNFYLSLVWLTSDYVLIAILALALLLVMGLLLIHSEMPPELYHRHSPNDVYVPPSLRLGAGSIASDYDRLRYILKKKLILKHDLEDQTEEQEIAEFIDNERVRRFFKNRRDRPSYQDLIKISRYISGID